MQVRARVRWEEAAGAPTVGSAAARSVHHAGRRRAVSAPHTRFTPPHKHFASAAGRPGRVEPLGNTPSGERSRPRTRPALRSDVPHLSDRPKECRGRGRKRSMGTQTHLSSQRGGMSQICASRRSGARPRPVAVVQGARPAAGLPQEPPHALPGPPPPLLPPLRTRSSLPPSTPRGARLPCPYSCRCHENSKQGQGEPRQPLHVTWGPPLLPPPLAPPPPLPRPHAAAVTAAARDASPYMAPPAHTCTKRDKQEASGSAREACEGGPAGSGPAADLFGRTGPYHD